MKSFSLLKNSIVKSITYYQQGEQSEQCFEHEKNIGQEPKVRYFLGFIDCLHMNSFFQW